MKRILMIGILLISIVFTGCIRKIDKADLKTNLINIGAIPKDISMLKVGSDTNFNLEQSLFGTLVRLNEFNDVEPYIAKEYSVSEDKLTHTFVIDDNAYWSDGQKITARDFYNCFQEIFSSKVDSNIDLLLASVTNLNAYKKNRALFSKVGIKMVGTNKLEFILTEEFSELPKVLAMPQFSLRKDVSKLSNWKENYANIVFSGAYTVSEIRYNKGIVLKANKNYIFKDEVLESEILIVESSSQEEAIANFNAKNLQLTINPPINQLSDYMNSSNLIISSSNDIKGIVFNQDSKSLVSDKGVRENILSYISATDICNKAFPNIVMKGSNIFDKEINVFAQNSIPVTKNLEKNIYETKENKSIILIAKKNDINKAIGQQIVDALKEGKYTARLNLLNEVEYELALENKQYDMILTDFTYRYDSDLTLIEKFYSKDFENYIGYRDGVFDELFKELIKADNSDTKYLKIGACKQRLEDEVVVIPLVQNINFILKTNKIIDIASKKNGSIDISKIKINN